MTRTKKFIISGLMVLVTSLTFLGSSVFNISRVLFPLTNVQASFVAGNTNGTPDAEGKTLLKGDIITVRNIPTTANKNVPKELPIASSITFNDDSEIYEIKTKTDDASTVGVTTTDSEGTTASTIFVEIKDPYRTPLTRFVEADTTAGMVIDNAQVQIDSGKLTLTPSRAGVYTVQYFAFSENNKVWTNTGVYQINVTSRAYNIEMQKNDSIVMPTTLRIDESNTTDNWANRNVQISLPLLHDENGNLIENTDIILGDQQYEDPDNSTDPFYYVLNYQDITKANTPASTTLNAQTSLNLSAGNLNIYEIYKTYTVKKVGGLLSDLTGENFVLYVEVKNSESGTYSNYGSISGTNSLLTLSDDLLLNGDYLPYTASAYAFTAVGGKNVITYKLFKKHLTASGSNAIDSNLPDSWLSHTVTGSTSYDSENIELAATTSSTVKATSVSFKEKVYLPSISATNKNNNNNSINVYYYYVVKVVKSDGSFGISSSEVLFGRDDGGLYFIPNASSGSKYEISYNVVDFYGNTVEDDENYNYEITIIDRNPPVVSYVKSFDSSKTKLEQIDSNDYSYIVASKYAIKEATSPRPTTAKPVQEDYLDSNDEPNETAYQQALSDYNVALNNYRASLTKILIPAVFATDPSGFNSKRRTLTSSSFLDANKENISGTININDNYGATSSTISNISNDVLKYFISFIDENKYSKEIADYGTTNGDALRDEKMSDVAVLYVDPEFFGAGSYTLSLTVVDGQYNSNTKTREFRFELVDETFDTTRPTVEFKNSTVGNVSDGQNISLALPTITDEINDRYLVKHYALIEETGIGEDENVFIPLSLDATGANIVFNTSDRKNSSDADTSIHHLASLSPSKSFKVVTFVFNGYVDNVKEVLAEIEGGTFDFVSYKYGSKYVNVGYGERKISIKYIKDNVAPKFVTFDDLFFDYETFNQFATLSIPGFVFYDDTPDATITVSIVNTAGTSQSSDKGLKAGTNVKLLSTPTGDYTYEYTFAGLDFIPTNADKGNYYTVTYTLQDSGKNVVSYSFVLTHANDKEGPTIQGIPGSTVTIQLGQAYDLEELTATDNYSEQSEITYVANCLLDGKYVRDYYNNLTKVFSPREVGTYQIQLIAVDKDLNESSERTFTIVVKDTLKPEMGELPYFEETISEEEITDNEFPTVTIPAAIWIKPEPDNLRVDNVLSIAEEKITIKTPTNDSDGKNEYVYNVLGELISGGNDALNLGKEGDAYKFTPNARGKYTVTYYCKDSSGNEESKSVTIDVGDTTSPNIYLTTAFKGKLDKGFVIGTNDSLNINIRARISTEPSYTSKDLYVSDNFGFTTMTIDGYNYVKVDVSITDSSDKEVEALTKTDDIYTYQFTTSGTYKITFKVTDEVGNQGTFTRTFSVSAATSSAADAATIIGTVLIAVSAVILLGVLVYFIKGTKLISKKKTLKKTTKKPD